jgi:hypothetical protein
VTHLERRAFYALHDLVYGGEFAAWLKGKEMPFAAARELDEATAVLAELCAKVAEERKG